MIVVEGSDNVGKTTACLALARMIAEETRRRPEECYRHMSRPPPGFDHMREYSEMVGPHAQDRFHLGAVAYGRLGADGTCPSARQMRIVQRMLRWQGVLVVVMHAERDWLRRSQFAKQEMYALDTILDVNDAFRMLAVTANRGEPYCDLDYDVSKHGYPDERVLRGWVDQWRASWCG